MLSEKNCTTFLTLAGSTSAAGCMKIYSDMIKYNMIDVIVATGASIIDMDFFEALGFPTLSRIAISRRHTIERKLYRPNI